MSAVEPREPRYTLWQLALYGLRLGAIGFGGPVALIGYMYRDLVERRQWISESDFKEGLTLAQLMPGPLAAQLAMYLGYVHYRVLGASVLGVAFVLPSFWMVVALGWLYVRFGGLAWMQAAFYGVGAAVIGIIAISAYKLTAKNVGRDPLLWGIYVACALITAVTASEFVWVFVLGGVLVWLVRAPPKWLNRAGSASSVAVALFPTHFDWPLLGQILGFFTKAGAFVFGSGLAIVPFLYGGVVTEHHWLTEREFVDAVAVAMITPGPVVITVGFIGYLIAGLPGAAAAAVGTFLPCYLFTIIPAPYFRKHGKRPGIVAFVNGATAAAIGTITGAAFVLGERSVVDLPTLLIGIAAAFVLWKSKRLQEPWIIAGAAAIGLAIFPFAGHASSAVPPTAFAAGHESGLPLEVVADVPLPGDTSRFDYESYDRSRQRLFIAHLGQSEVVAFDTRTRQVVGRLPGIGHVHGVLAIPELGRVYASATKSDEVVAIDAERLTEVARMPGGTYPDGMAYAPAAGKLYVSDETGKTETVIDVRSNRRVATIPLAGEVGNTQYDPVSGHIFVNVQTRGQLVEIDPASDRIVAREDLPGADGNHGLLIEPASHLAFVACEGNDKLLVFDLQARRIAQSFATGHEPDVLDYDARLGLLYVASESGTVSMFKLQAGRLEKIADGLLAANAHVVAVDPDTHLAYFPIKNLEGHPALRITRPAPQQEFHVSTTFHCAGIRRRDPGSQRSRRVQGMDCFRDVQNAYRTPTTSALYPSRIPPNVPPAPDRCMTRITSSKRGTRTSDTPSSG
jgi:chromate transporter